LPIRNSPKTAPMTPPVFPMLCLKRFIGSIPIPGRVRRAGPRDLRMRDQRACRTMEKSQLSRDPDDALPPSISPTGSRCSGGIGLRLDQVSSPVPQLSVSRARADCRRVVADRGFGPRVGAPDFATTVHCSDTKHLRTAKTSRLAANRKPNGPGAILQSPDCCTRSSAAS
jgi:hypothetical protein